MDILSPPVVNALAKHQEYIAVYKGAAGKAMAAGPVSSSAQRAIATQIFNKSYRDNQLICLSILEKETLIAHTFSVQISTLKKLLAFSEGPIGGENLNRLKKLFNDLPEKTQSYVTEVFLQAQHLLTQTRNSLQPDTVALHGDYTEKLKQLSFLVDQYATHKLIQYKLNAHLHSVYTQCKNTINTLLAELQTLAMHKIVQQWEDAQIALSNLKPLLKATQNWYALEKSLTTSMALMQEQVALKHTLMQSIALEPLSATDKERAYAKAHALFDETLQQSEAFIIALLSQTQLFLKKMITPLNTEEELLQIKQRLSQYAAIGQGLAIASISEAIMECQKIVEAIIFEKQAPLLSAFDDIPDMSLDERKEWLADFARTLQPLKTLVNTTVKTAMAPYTKKMFEYHIDFLIAQQATKGTPSQYDSAIAQAQAEYEKWKITQCNGAMFQAMGETGMDARIQFSMNASFAEPVQQGSITTRIIDDYFAMSMGTTFRDKHAKASRTFYSGHCFLGNTLQEKDVTSLVGVLAVDQQAQRFQENKEGDNACIAATLTIDKIFTQYSTHDSFIENKENILFELAKKIKQYSAACINVAAFKTYPSLQQGKQWVVGFNIGDTMIISYHPLTQTCKTLANARHIILSQGSSPLAFPQAREPVLEQRFIQEEIEEGALILLCCPGFSQYLPILSKKSSIVTKNNEGTLEFFCDNTKFSQGIASRDLEANLRPVDLLNHVISQAVQDTENQRQVVENYLPDVATVGGDITIIAAQIPCLPAQIPGTAGAQNKRLGRIKQQVSKLCRHLNRR